MIIGFQLLQISVFIISIGHISCAEPSGSCTENEDKFMEECNKQTSYFLTNQKGMAITVHYDAGGFPQDRDFIRSACKARLELKSVKICFSVGLAIKRGQGGKLECGNVDKTNKDCTLAFQDACASQLVPDFSEYVCCSYSKGDITSAGKQCFQKQNNNLDELEKCQNLQNPSIKPDEILLANSEKATSSYDKKFGYPFIIFNGQTEECARNIFKDDSVKVICAMLAPGVEPACNSPP